MRVVSGKLGGRIIKLPSFFEHRPTTDKAKEGLFNILDNYFYLDTVTVLDLFSGTGNVSYEFASRGAIQLTCVEKNRRYATFIEKTAEKFNLEKLTVIESDVLRFLEISHTQYDIVFADPPYSLPELEQIPDLIFKNNLLKPDAWFILEHPADYNFKKHPHFFRMRKYGRVHFSFFKQELKHKNLE